MITLLAEHLDRYVTAHAAPEDPLFAELSDETRKKTDLPQMMVGPVEGALLRCLVRISGARHVLEIGTFTGYSALAMAMGLPESGRLTTCDVSEAYTEIARKYWAKSPHGKKIRLHLGPALETIATLESGLDMVFIDADKENYIAYWEAVLPRLRPGGLVAADNVLWSGKVTEPADTHDADTAALRAFSAHVHADPRVDHVMLGIRDGIMLAVKL